MERQQTIQSLLELIKSGNPLDSIEASKDLLKRKLKKDELYDLVKLLEEGKEVQNKVNAAYALSWMFLENNKSALPFLIEHLNNETIHPEVRAQCAEGIAYTEPDKRNKYRRIAEKALLKNLKDESPEVRFWCCFATGHWKIKKAISTLRSIQNHDSSICSGWWYVSEEAEDAIDTILGKERKNRLPISLRK